MWVAVFGHLISTKPSALTKPSGCAGHLDPRVDDKPDLGDLDLFVELIGHAGGGLLFSSPAHRVVEKDGAVDPVSRSATSSAR